MRINLLRRKSERSSRKNFEYECRNMTSACFQNLPDALCASFAKAEKNIRAAVCWFSHKDIFDMLLTRLRAGVRIEMLLEYDTQNICADKLDFQQFIRSGGRLYAFREAGLMHHKFAIVDDRLLLTGSFNWTYNSNAENLLLTDDTAALTAYRDEFERLKLAAKRIFQVRREEAKVFSTFTLFENTRFQQADLRKKVSGGAGVWLVRLDKLKADNNLIFRKNCLPFDAAGLLAPYWTAYRMWDEELFGEETERLKTRVKANALRDLRLWSLRMKTGDVVLAVERKNRLIAIGIVQSQPQPFEGEGFSSFRDVQWVKIMEGLPYYLEYLSPLAITKFRGSALKLLNDVFKT